MREPATAAPQLSLDRRAPVIAGARLHPLGATRVGHLVRLWCYDEPAGVPEGVMIADASEILPRTAICRHRTGSVSLFSNWFRYELQRRGHGVWIDADHYFLKPIELVGPYLLARQAPQVINGGILLLPCDSPMLPELIAPFAAGEVAWWLPLSHRVAARMRKWRNKDPGLPDLPWGTFGPNALTATAQRHRLFHLAAPPSVYSPVPWQEAEWIVDSRRTLRGAVQSTTVAVHLWNERIRHLKERPAPQGTFLARLQAEGA